MYAIQGDKKAHDSSIKYDVEMCLLRALKQRYFALKMGFPTALFLSMLYVGILSSF